MVSKALNTGTTQYRWDFENRLSSTVMAGSGGTVTFMYDPFGRRVQKAFTQGTTTTTTNYLYDGANDVEEVDQNGNLITRYSQGAGIDEPLAEFRSSTASFYEQDGLGSVTSLGGSTGTLANTYIYKAFGDLASSSGNTVNPFQYTGRDYDPETGLRYYRARYYDATTGRFLGEDRMRWLVAPDFYVYTGNNPVRFRDPSGLIHQAWGEPPFDGRLHDDPGAGLEVLCTNPRTKARDIEWLTHSIAVRNLEIATLGQNADAGHILRVTLEIATLEHCNQCENEKPAEEPETTYWPNYQKGIAIRDDFKKKVFLNCSTATQEDSISASCRKCF